MRRRDTRACVAALLLALSSIVVSGFLPTVALAEVGSRTAAREARQGNTVSRSVWSAVYTAKQAEAGEKIYFDRCVTCHGDDLSGRESASALAGAQFLDAWHGRNLRRLIERIEDMPPGDPKKLSTAESVDVLAFLLYSSEMPSGSTALPADRAQLAEITFERKKP